MDPRAPLLQGPYRHIRRVLLLHAGGLPRLVFSCCCSRRSVLPRSARLRLISLLTVDLFVVGVASLYSCIAEQYCGGQGGGSLSVSFATVLQQCRARTTKMTGGQLLRATQRHLDAASAAAHAAAAGLQLQYRNVHPQVSELIIQQSCDNFEFAGPPMLPVRLSVTKLPRTMNFPFSDC
jgi:hypothetical protein